jgi:hypothetical protein
LLIVAAVDGKKANPFNRGFIKAAKYDILGMRGGKMNREEPVQTQKMSFEERLAIDKEFIERMNTGSYEEASAWYRAKTPMYPWLAKIIKEKVGADFLRQQGYNLSEAEAEFGSDWLDK